MIKDNRHSSVISVLIAAVMLAVSVIVLPGCSELSGAEARVSEDLESMRYVELDPAVSEEIEDMLSDTGREYFEMFLGKAGEFDYEIVSSEEGDDATVVKVRITTCDFASEYLRTWSEFLEEQSGTDGQSEFDSGLLYETLFKNLSVIRKKDYISYVDINCIQDEAGEWQTDAKSSPELMNAILGGMVSEMKNLAELGE